MGQRRRSRPVRQKSAYPLTAAECRHPSTAAWVRKRHAGHPATMRLTRLGGRACSSQRARSRSFPPISGRAVNVALTPSLCLSANTSFPPFPDTERPNPTFSSAATQTPDSRLITLLCGWYRPLCHSHQDRPTESSRDQKIGLEQLHLPTIPFPLESPCTVPDRS